LITLVRHDGEVFTFDPYSILGIESGTSANMIKKAYRKLSLKFHPDKNPGDKTAEDTFMKIAKAYEALTDETAKENYEKYGNPDGKQALEVSIGLPKILLANPKIVLVLYLIAMVVVIPIGVAIWYSNSKKYGEKNIMYETNQWFFQLIKEDQKLSGLPEILATSAEFRDIIKKAKLNEEDSRSLINFSKKAYIFSRRKVTVNPNGIPSRTLKPAIEFFASVKTGCCPVIKRISSVAFCKNTRFCAFNPNPALT
jgi:translocation protein SEC63